MTGTLIAVCSVIRELVVPFKRVLELYMYAYQFLSMSELRTLGLLTAITDSDVEIERLLYASDLSRSL
jgi:hypothetical protein